MATGQCPWRTCLAASGGRAGSRPGGVRTRLARSAPGGDFARMGGGSFGKSASHPAQGDCDACRTPHGGGTTHRRLAARHGCSAPVGLLRIPLCQALAADDGGCGALGVSAHASGRARDCGCAGGSKTGRNVGQKMEPGPHDSDRVRTYGGPSAIRRGYDLCFHGQPRSRGPLPRDRASDHDAPVGDRPGSGVGRGYRGAKRLLRDHGFLESRAIARLSRQAAASGDRAGARRRQGMFVHRLHRDYADTRLFDRTALRCLFEHRAGARKSGYEGRCSKVRGL